MRKFSLLLVIFVFGLMAVNAQTQPPATPVDKTWKIVDELIATSFPVLKNETIKIEAFQSSSDYFKANFSLGRYATFRKMQYKIEVNPAVYVRNAPEDGIKAILAHELAHIVYYRGKNRAQLLGLGKLAADKSFTAKFERKADLEAIAAGYGEGLIAYRKWLYKNIGPEKLEEKRRNYFSPEEIELILQIMKKKPGVINYWRENVPRNLEDIRLQDN